MTTLPIPVDALDDRLGVVGTSGSGKTYGTGVLVERLLAQKRRVVIPDPLGVWWGLRLDRDGATKAFDVVIFGGPHGDLPITEHAGAIIGETVAGMKESAIIDLSGLGTKAAERRFMLAFLTALYKNASGEQLHVVFDEADMWAPQQIRDRDQEPQKLLGMMETIVRRGRIKGFVPWLITQRPAVLNKDVLSMVDGLVAFKLTSKQDRDALGGWIEGQADKGDWPRIRAELASRQVGEAIVWLPARGVLATEKFPEKRTFDSSRAPKKGEKRKTAELAPLDLGKLKDRLATVEQEVKQNDPKALKAEIARLKADLQKRPQNIPQNITADPKAIEDARQEGYDEGIKKARATVDRLLHKVQDPLGRAETALAEARNLIDDDLLSAAFGPAPTPAKRPAKIPDPRSLDGMARLRPDLAMRAAAADTAGDTTLGLGERRVLTAIAQHGGNSVSREGLSVMTGYKRSSRNTYLQRLLSAGLIATSGDRLIVTAAGVAALGPDFEPLPIGAALREHWLRHLPEGERKVFEAALRAYPDAISRVQLQQDTGYQRSSTNTYLQRLAARDLVVAKGADVSVSAHLFS